MQDLIATLMRQVKVTEAQAAGGAALLLKVARDKLGGAQFDSLLGGIEGLSTLLKRAPKAGGLGGMFGSMAGAVGGERAAIIATVVGGFRKLGLNPDHAKAFVPVIVEHLRAKLDPDVVERIEKMLRG